MDLKSKEKTPKQGKTYDIPLRKLLKDLPTQFLNLIGISVDPHKVKFLDVKLPKLFEREADLVFEHQGNIYHIEIQSVDDPKMADRMLYYYLLIKENYGKAPKQFVVYVGEKPPKRMKLFLEEENLKFSYTLIDINQVDCSKLLESPSPSDWALAVLCKMEDEVKGIREILKRVAQIENQEERRRYIELILHIARLRPKRLDLLKREEEKMPIIIEVEKDPFYKEGLEKGLEKAKKEDAINLYKETKWPLEKIAKVLNVSKEKVEKWLKEAKLLS